MDSIETTVLQKIYIGEYEVLSSGSLIVPLSKDIEFIFDNLKFRVVFEMEKDDNGNLTQGHYSLNIEKDENSGLDFLKITMYNQNNSFFSSSNSMLQVATLNKRKLYFKFCINSINKQNDEGKEDKIFYYTWLLEKIIDSTK